MTPLPIGFRLALDPSVRRFDDGAVLAGGVPFRLMRLTDAGRAALDALLAGRAESVAARQLGRRLVSAGLAHPRAPRTGAGAPGVTVVIPVRDRTDALARCLTALGRAAPVIVVDDGSADPVAIAAVCREHGARVVRRAHSGGPAAARNSALDSVGTEFVAFLDSDCVSAPEWLAGLTGHFGDPLVAAVAPRIEPCVPGPAVAPSERFAVARCPLDLGAQEDAVRPDGRLRYVPTAALVVRRAALPAFDAGLRYGEDVDAIWRLHDAGWVVRYDPSVAVGHGEPRGWHALLARRFRYGTAAGPLARRHPGRLAALDVPGRPLLAVLLLLAGRPRAAGAVVVVEGAVLARRTRTGSVPAPQALVWAGQSTARAFLGLGRATTMFAAPGLLFALGGRRTRAAALGLLLAPPLQEWLARRPTLDPVRWSAACVADDVAYGLGVWRGCLAARTLAPLRPRVRRGSGLGARIP